MPEPIQSGFADITAEVISAYVTNNHVRPSEFPALIASVYAAFTSLDRRAPGFTAEPGKLVPPVSIKKSVTDAYLVSMEDGKRYQSLKRHLAGHGLTPAEYRSKWGLPSDYPMVAPGYSARRSALAKEIGLGNSRRKPV